MERIGKGGSILTTFTFGEPFTIYRESETKKLVRYAREICKGKFAS